MKIGVLADNFKIPFDRAVPLASSMGIAGVQIYAHGEFGPEQITKQRIQSAKRLLSDFGMQVSAVCGDTGGHGFEREADNGARIEHTKRVIEMTAALSCPTITTHIGVIPADEACARYRVMRRALCEVGRYCKANGVTLAIETGPEPAAVLRKFIDGLEGGVGVNLDPANFVMVTGQDPVEAVRLLSPYIVHTHAKDGIRKQATDPKIIYDFFADGGIEDLRLSDYFAETPLGLGQVDFAAYIAALKEVGYDGYLTIERETGDKPQDDIALAVRFLKRFIQ